MPCFDQLIVCNVLNLLPTGEVAECPLVVNMVGALLLCLIYFSFIGCYKRGNKRLTAADIPTKSVRLEFLTDKSGTWQGLLLLSLICFKAYFVCNDWLFW